MENSKKRSTGYESVIILILCMGTGAVMAARFGITSTFAYIKDIAITPVTMGLIMSAHAIAWAISSLVLGSLADFVQKQKLFLVGCLVLSSVATGLIGFAPNIQTVVILRVIIGVFQGPMLPLLQSTARMISSPSRVGFNQGCLIAGSSLLGQSLPAAIIPTIASKAPDAWRNPVVIIGIFGLGTAILLGLFIKGAKIEQPSGEKHSPDSKISKKEIIELLKTRNFVGGVLGAVGAIGWTLCMSTYTAAYLETQTNAGTTRLSLIIAVGGIASMVSNIVLPAISDKIGRKPAYILCSVGLLLSPLVLIIFQNNMNSPMALILYTLSSLICGCAMTLNTYVIVGESVAPIMVAMAYSICLCAGEILGGTVGPAIAGMLANKFGLSAAMGCAVGFGCICFFVSILTKETLKDKKKTKKSF